MVRTPCLAAALAFCGLALAQSHGTQPKPKPSDYPARAQAGDVTIAAEYLVHTVPTGKQSVIVPDYLVVEVAAYPPKATRLEIASGMFTLRVNGKKELEADSPGIAAASVKYPDWERHPNLEVGAGPVILGRNDPIGRFPGDNRDPRGQRPQVPQTDTGNPGGVEREQPQSGSDAVVETAFPDGPAAGPVSGYLFFRFRGKTKSIKSLELIYRRGDDQTPIRLF